MMNKKFLLSTILILEVLCFPAFSLTDSEYLFMMKNPGFARTDKELSRAWKQANSGLSKEARDLLLEDQRNWIAFGRDEAAEKYIGDYSRTEAYRIATEQRIEELPKLREKYFLMTNFDDVQGYYVRINDYNEQDGELRIKWLNKRSRRVSITIHSVYAYDEDDIRSNTWQTQGTIKNNTLIISPESYPDCIMTLKFHNNKIIVSTSEDFDYYNLGASSAVYDGIFIKLIE